jgi:hypothetical protein
MTGINGELAMKKRNTCSTVARILFAMFGIVVLSASFGCNQGREGDRCNPTLSTDDNECNSGLTCQQSPTCAENYCCPTSLTSSLNPYCNGSACPAPDAGMK